MPQRAGLLMIVALAAGCGAKQGSEGGACYPNRSCDAELVCLSDLCVKAPALDTDDDGPITVIAPAAVPVHAPAPTTAAPPPAPVRLGTPKLERVPKIGSKRVPSINGLPWAMSFLDMKDKYGLACYGDDDESPRDRWGKHPFDCDPETMAGEGKMAFLAFQGWPVEHATYHFAVWDLEGPTVPGDTLRFSKFSFQFSSKRTDKPRFEDWCEGSLGPATTRATADIGPWRYEWKGNPLTFVLRVERPLMGPLKYSGEVSFAGTVTF